MDKINLKQKIMIISTLGVITIFLIIVKHHSKHYEKN